MWEILQNNADWDCFKILTESVRSSSGRTFLGKAIPERFLFNTVVEKFQIGNVSSLTEKKHYSYLCMWTISNWLERNKILTQRGKYS